MVRRFFSFVMLVVIGTLAQDVLLEPYGALALGLSVGQTTSLTAIWGAGTILSMMAAGAWLIKRFGYASIVRVGLWLGVFVFTGIIVTGVIKSSTVFMILVFFLGVCTGLSASGMLTAVIEFTTAVRAGLLMGVWGVAYELGHAFGSLISGVIVDLGRALTGGNITLTYSFIFALEAILLVIALGIFKKIDITQSAVLKEQPSRG